MRSPLIPALILALSGACGSTCEVDAPLDHADDALWLCKPGVGSCEAPQTVHTVEADGTTTPSKTQPTTEDDVACFVVYPTVDLRIGAGLHHQVARVDPPRTWVEGPPRLLAEVCTVWAPIYRQVTIGTYAGQATDRKDLCFDNAYGDVEAAFRTFLSANPDAGIVLFGHSQGGQHLSRLLADVIERDQTLRDRLVVAWPLGWSLGTAEGEPSGGSFDTLPVCATPSETGCVMGFRSYYAGRDLPGTGRFSEGEEQVCTHPGSPELDDPAPLSAFTARVGDAFVDAPRGLDADADDLVRWPGAMEAACRGDGDRRALAVSWVHPEPRPFDPGGLLLSGDNGTHVLDVQLGMSDIVADVARRAEAWRTVTGR